MKYTTTTDYKSRTKAQTSPFVSAYGKGMVANVIHSLDSKQSLGILMFEESLGVTEGILMNSKELEAISNKVREELIKNAMVVYGD